MNSTKTEIVRISSKFDPLDLDLVYEFCRALPPIPDASSNNDQKPQFYNINDAPVIESLKSSLRLFKKQLMNLIKSIPIIFHPAFIELSLYDPRDRSGKIFYSVLFADDEDAITCYRKQMEGNLEQMDSLDPKSRSKRGPIIPNKLLHESVYYSLPINLLNESSNGIKFNVMGDDLKAIFAGSYNTSKKIFTNRKENLDYNIENFLKDVSSNCMQHLGIDKGGHEFNFAALLPLFRPAARFKGEQEIIYNGGGIFLYGNLQKPEDESEFILALQTILTKSIFKASHSQIHFDEVDAFKSIFTAMLIHQIKNKLTNQITQEIVELLKRNDLDAEIINTLMEVKNSSMNIVKKFSTYLNNLGLRLSQTDIPMVDFSGFKSIVNGINNTSRIRIKVISNPINSSAVIKVNKDILEAILDQLFENAVKYYSDNEINIADENIIVKWSENLEQNIVQISVINSNSVMDDETLSNYGMNPIKDTSSTGLGGLFINNILEQIEAKRFDDGRYFKPSNERDGFRLLINFNLHKVVNGN